MFDPPNGSIFEDTNLGTAGGLAAPTFPSDSGAIPAPESFFVDTIHDVLGGRILIGATQAGGWIAVQIENAAGSIRVVLDENQIDQLILALAHQS
jgi:hypothetical protein